MRTIRRDLHRHPELADEERWTHDRLRSALDGLGVRATTFARSTALLATLPGAAGRPVVALRADMDGLPIEETTGAAFRSQNPGRMHACGHDVHMASLLGAARLLLERPVEGAGPVRLLFQPAEEDGIRGGAAGLIERGALARPRVGFVLGQHVEPSLPVGSVGMRAGPMMAAADNFELTVTGRGGHGAYPHLGADAVFTAAEVIVGLQGLVARTKNPVEPGVISVGSVHGGDRPNVLPGEVRLRGTVRTFSPELRSQFARDVPRRARSIARSLGASARVKYERGYPALVNDPVVTECVGARFRAGWGSAAVRTLPEPVMGAEDFARYLEQVPGTFWFLGVGSPGRKMAGKHSADFLPDERALITGAEALVLGVEALAGGRR